MGATQPEPGAAACGHWRIWDVKQAMSRMLCAAAAAAALTLTGCCTFLREHGGGPLRRQELGDWAGMQAEPELDPKDLRQNEEKLRLCITDIFAGEYSTSQEHQLQSHPLAAGLDLEGRSDPWLHLIASVRQADWLFHRRYAESARRFYAREVKWGLGWLLPLPFGELLFCGRQIDAYDVDSGKRVGAVRSSIFLTPLFYIRERVVRPVDNVGRAGLRAIIDAKKDISAVQYEVKDVTVVLLGALAWGRVNRQSYAQVLWMSFPLGTESGSDAPP